MYLIDVFLIYSIIGHLFEVVVDLILNIKPGSGILYGPWPPIYGFGVLIMLFIKKRLEKYKLNKFLEICLYFLIVVLILTILEELGGVLLAKVFNKTLWDYSNLNGHITKYIAIETSLGWGLGSILIGYVIHPHLKKLIKKIPFFLSALLFISFMIDVVVTICLKI